MLAVVSSPDGAGTVYISPDRAKYEPYDLITMTATPSAGYIFESWSGEVDVITDTSQNPVTFMMGDNPDNTREITAIFIPSNVICRITTIVQPNGGGSVSLQPGQAADGYPINECVSVFAVANSGYVFSRWSGALAGSENPRSFRLSDDRSITAIFSPTVTVYCSPSQGGSVSLQPQAPNGYDVGTKVTMSAKPARGYRFVAWEGDLSGKAKSVTITVDEAKTITARFAEESSSRWWLWVAIGVGGLFATLVLVRLVYARMGRAALEGSVHYDE